MRQGSPEWIEWRRCHIGASDVAKIMGLSEYATPYQVWLSKMGLDTPVAQTWAQAEGHRREEAARLAFEQLTGHVVFPDTVEHATVPYLCASLDGISIDRSVAVELKWNGAERHAMAKSGTVPPDHMIQVQAQLEVTGLQSMYYFSMGQLDNCCIFVSRDDSMIGEILKSCATFWDCVTSGNPPMFTDKDVCEREDKKWTEVASEYVFTQNQITLAEEKLAGLKQRLLDLAKDTNCVGGGVKLTRSIRTGSVDYSAIPELKNVDLQLYRKKPTVSWRITQT